MTLLTAAQDLRVRDLLVPELPERALITGILPRRRGGYFPGAAYNPAAGAPGAGSPGGSPGSPGLPPGGGGGGSVPPGYGIPPEDLGLSLVLGDGFPVWLSAAPNTNSVLGAVAGPIRGPLVCTEFYLAPQVNTISGAPPQCWFRVDFSEFDAVQTFTAGATARPTGGAADGLTLFPAAGHTGGTDGDIGATNDGWVRVASNITGSVDPVFGQVWRYIPFERIFVKFYMNNDQTNQRFPTLLVNFRRVSSAYGAFVPPTSPPVYSPIGYAPPSGGSQPGSPGGLTVVPATAVYS